MIDERLEGRFGPIGVLADERVNGRERIEKEMRLDLRLQHRQAQIGLVLVPAQRGELASVLRLLPDALLAEKCSERKPSSEA